MQQEKKMNKWKKYGSYEVWKSSEEGFLRVKYDEYIEAKYIPIQPDTFVNFDDFCMGQWQNL